MNPYKLVKQIIGCNVCGELDNRLIKIRYVIIIIRLINK